MYLRYGNSNIQLEKSSNGIVNLSEGSEVKKVEDPTSELEKIREKDIATRTYDLYIDNNLVKNDLIPNGEIYFSNYKEEELVDIINTWKLEHRYDLIDGSVYSVTKESRNPITVCLEIQNKYKNIIAEPELFHPPILYYYQWHLENTGLQDIYPANFYKKGEDIKAKSAWAVSAGDINMKVAIIDDAFDITHPDIKNVVSPFSFKNGNSNVTPVPGEWHGTACAGLINASGEVLGTCPNCSIIPIQFYYISDSMIENMFGYAIEKGAKVISCSWGASNNNFQLSTRMYNALKNAAKKAIILFAAGNSGIPVTEGSFAAHPDVLAVGAYNSKGEPSNYSNYGPLVNITAPSNGANAAGITTSDVVSVAGYSSNAYTFGFGGTSAATPIAAGAIAAAWSKNKEISVTDIRKLILESCDRSFPTFSKYGKLNQYALTQKVLNFTNSNTPASKITKTAEFKKQYSINNLKISKNEQVEITEIFDIGTYKITLFDSSILSGDLNMSIYNNDIEIYKSTLVNKSEVYVLTVEEKSEYKFIITTNKDEKLNLSITKY